MTPSRGDLKQVVEQGEEEGGSIEFKKRLRKDTHLEEGRRASLAAQLRHRVLSGNGEATYVVGVTDDGGLTGIPSDQFTESMDVLSLLCEESGCRIDDVQTWNVESGLVGLVTIREGGMIDVDDDHIVVGTAGHVDHGKSTLVGTIVTGDNDDGAGDLRGYLDTLPHEVERELSATLSHTVFGYDEEGEPIQLDDPTREGNNVEVVEESERLVSFVDTVGHKPWIRTTIRGLVGQRIDYGLLAVSADDGPTKITREHLGILLATDLPTIVVITKSDLVSDERIETVKRTIERHLRDAGKTPLRADRYSIDQVAEEVSENVVPIFVTSAVTREGIDNLEELFYQLPKTRNGGDEFRMYVDRVYDVKGVGAVASGAVKSGRVEQGDELLLGPFSDGSFEEVEVRSIELHHHRLDAADAGRLVGLNLKGVNAEDIERGMVLVHSDSNPTAVREFEAEVIALNHPTRITNGYEPIVHLETATEAAKVYPEDDYLLPGDKGNVKIRFKFSPYFIEEGQQFVFREGQTKGVGTVTRTITEE